MIVKEEDNDSTQNSAEKGTNDNIRPLRVDRKTRPLNTILLERGVSAEMQKMLLNPIVNAVLRGKQSGKPLDSETIRTLVSL